MENNMIDGTPFTNTGVGGGCVGESFSLPIQESLIC